MTKREPASVPAVPCGRHLPDCGAGPLESIYADNDPMCRTCWGGWTPHPEAVCPCCGSCCDCQCGPRLKSERARRELAAMNEAFQPCGCLERERCLTCRACRNCAGCHCFEDSGN